MVYNKHELQEKYEWIKFLESKLNSFTDADKISFIKDEIKSAKQQIRKYNKQHNFTYEDYVIAKTILEDGNCCIYLFKFPHFIQAKEDAYSYFWNNIAFSHSRWWEDLPHSTKCVVVKRRNEFFGYHFISY